MHVNLKILVMNSDFLKHNKIASDQGERWNSDKHINK